MNRTKLRGTALMVGAVLGVVCLLLAVLTAAFGFTPLVFRSGSMAPDYPTGSLALARSTPAADLRVGDVVSLVEDDGSRITHRITAVERDGRSAVLQTKGDANSVTDPGATTVTEADKVVASVPLLGYLVAWISGPLAVFLGGLLCGVLLMIAFRPGGRRDDGDGSAGEDEPTDEPSSETPSEGGSARRTVATLAVGAAGLVVAASAVPSTLAAFTDAATATSGTIASTGIDTPATPNVTQDSRTKQVTISWADVNLADGTDVSGYTVLRYSSMNDQNPATVCTTTTARTCTIGPSAGTVYYAVQSKYATKWVSTPSTKRSFTAS